MAGRTEDIANMALDLIGEPSINDIDDTFNQAAVKCKQYYDQARKEAFEEIQWVFATRESKLVRTTLPADKFPLLLSEISSSHPLPSFPEGFPSDVPTMFDGNQRAYTKQHPFVFNEPTEFVSVVQIFNGETMRELRREEWTRRYIPELANNFIVSQHPKLWIKYVYDVKDVTKWNAKIIKAVSTLLAYYISTPIKRDASVTQNLYVLYKDIVKDAAMDDLNENEEDMGNWTNEFTRSRG